MLPRFVILFAVVLSAVSCEKAAFFEEKRSIPGAEWTYRDTLDFVFTVTDTAELYNMYVEFEHAETYSNQNIYTRLYTRFPDGKRLGTMRSFDLFDAQGASAGRCSGGDCRVRCLLQDNAYFNRTGEYVITLEQFMRRDTVSGIQSVGLVIERTGKTKADVRGNKKQ